MAVEYLSVRRRFAGGNGLEIIEVSFIFDERHIENTFPPRKRDQHFVLTFVFPTPRQKRALSEKKSQFQYLGENEGCFESNEDLL